MEPTCHKCKVTMSFLHGKNGGRLYECPDCEGTELVPNPSRLELDRSKQPVRFVRVYFPQRGR